MPFRHPGDSFETAVGVKTESDSGARLNLGAGNAPLLGYSNIDRSYKECHGQTDEAGGILLCGEAFPLCLEFPRTPYGDDVAEEIRASHVLEHFSHTLTM